MVYALCLEALSHAPFPRTRIPVGFYPDSSARPVIFSIGNERSVFNWGLPREICGSNNEMYLTGVYPVKFTTVTARPVAPEDGTGVKRRAAEYAG